MDFFVSYNCLYLHYSINNKNFYLFLDMNIGNIISQSRDKNAYFQSDRSRTGGMLATYKVNDDLTLAFGASMMTGEANGEDDHTQGNPNYYPNEEKFGKNAGKMVGTHNEETNPNLRSGIFYAGAIYKGQATFFGDNRESRLRSIQNYIHKNMVHYTPYFADLGLKSKPYFYSGSFHSSYLFY